MKKILYYTVRDMTIAGQGINKKISTQIKTLRSYGYQVDAVYRKNDTELVMDTGDGTDHIIKSGMKRPYKVSASKYLTEYLKEKKYDGVYIRYVFADGQFYRLLKLLHAKNTKVIIEIPTYPYDVEFHDSLENRIVLLLDKLYRNRMKRYVDQIVTFSRDKSIYGIPTIQSCNGIDFSEVRIADHSNQQKDTISLIGVADLAPWHGYDRLIEGLGRYYNNGGKRKILFYLVGEGTELKRYQDLVEQYNIKDCVILCRSKFGKELDKIYDKCDIAVECLGLHRKGLTLSSSLKSREYAAKGLPMITSTDIDIFNADKYPYICQFPSDETAIDIDRLVKFYDTIYGGKNKNEIASSIREYAKELGDIKVVMEPIHRFFEN